MNVVFYLSSKYLKLRKAERGISTVGIIAFFTIVVSTAAGIIILSAVNGMHEDLMSRIMAKDAHILVLGPGKGIVQYEDYITNILEVEGVTSVVPFWDGQVLVKGDNRVWGAALKALPASYFTNDALFQTEFPIERGSYEMERSRMIILGYQLATNIGASVGSKVNLTVYSDDYFSSQHPFLVSGIFNSGYAEYDANLIFISFDDAQTIYDSDGYAYGLAIKVENPEEVDSYKSDISDVCPYYQWTWKRLNRNKLVSLENEKMLMMIILFIFFAVVFFNILSTMIAMVLDKREAVGILKAIGLNPTESLYIFILDGFIMGVGGSALGILFGLLFSVSVNAILTLIEKIIDLINWGGYFLTGWIVKAPKPTPFSIFSGDMAEFPIMIQYGDIVFVTVLAVIVSTLAVVIPAWKAARMRPVEVLRND